jgi:hypothetical protein
MIDHRGMSLTDRAWLRCCPELRMIDDPAQLEAVLRRIRGRPTRLSDQLRVAVICAIVVVNLLIIANNPFAVGTWSILTIPSVVSLLSLTWPAIIPVPALQSATRRRVREYMAENAVPICVPCGHDLRGIPGPFCPECGSPTIYLVYAKPATARTPVQPQEPSERETPQ